MFTTFTELGSVMMPTNVFSKAYPFVEVLDV